MDLCLTFNIAQELLQGNLGRLHVMAHAVSGGRAGTRTPNAENWWLRSNAFATSVKDKRTSPQYGGPIPIGTYRMRPHEDQVKRKHMTRLVPVHSNQMFNRDGFLIHGRGKIGSIGCIVLYDSKMVVEIFEAVKDYIAQRRIEPLLGVVAIGQDLDQKFFTA